MVTPLKKQVITSGVIPDLDRQETIDQFSVTLDVFTGPFDLLLQLISRKKLDITEVALSEVTDEFIAYTSSFPDLSRTTEFLVVAATLLSMKAAHLLPRIEGDADQDREDLEARDLLFSRLLQYRAFKQVAVAIGQQLEDNKDFIARSVPLEPQFAVLLPELVWHVTPTDLAHLAADAFSHRPPRVDVNHLHHPLVSVHEQAMWIAARLRQCGHSSFHQLVAEAATTALMVSRFLALLVLYRQKVVEFDQTEALGELTVIWIGEGINLDEEWDSAEE